MPSERRPSSNQGRRPDRPGRPDARRTGRPRRDPRATPTTDGERPNRAARGRRPERVAPRRVEKPQTTAQIRAAEVKARRGPRPPKEVVEPPPWEREVWVEEAPLRSEARRAAERAQHGTPIKQPTTANRRRGSSELAPEIADELQRATTPQSATKYKQRLASAADALDRGRFDDARRLVQPVLRELPDLAFGHEIAGLAFYSTGQWRKAVAELERARELDRSLNHHAVLADSYRALKRYDMVERLWLELREGSPQPALMAEGRIVAAGARADQGDLAGALKIMERGADVPKKVREHHLRQWYVIGDLHDRSGDVIKARRLFGMIAARDADFADVSERLRALGA